MCSVIMCCTFCQASLSGKFLYYKYTRRRRINNSWKKRSDGSSKRKWILLVYPNVFQKNFIFLPLNVCGTQIHLTGPWPCFVCTWFHRYLEQGLRWASVWKHHSLLRSFGFFFSYYTFLSSSLPSFFIFLSSLFLCPALCPSLFLLIHLSKPVMLSCE